MDTANKIIEKTINKEKANPEKATINGASKKENIPCQGGSYITSHADKLYPSVRKEELDFVHG